MSAAPTRYALGQVSPARPGRRVWLAASTHEGEEEAVLEAHALLREAHPGTNEAARMGARMRRDGMLMQTLMEQSLDFLRAVLHPTHSAQTSLTPSRMLH